MIPTGLMVKELIPNVCELTQDELNVLLPLVKAELATRWDLGSADVWPGDAQIPARVGADQYMLLRQQANCSPIPPALPRADHPASLVFDLLALAGGAALAGLMYVLASR